MKTAKKLVANRRRYTPEWWVCLQCQRRLRRVFTLSDRTIITLNEVVRVVHEGYRCPDPQCAGRDRVYRSAAADALALPGMTYGLDVLIRAGTLRWAKDQTPDEIYWDLFDDLEALGMGASISRGGIYHLFDAYNALLRAGNEIQDDQEWLLQAGENGGIIVSMDGIPGKGSNGTVYIVRDALTNRVLSASHVLVSGITVLKEFLAPVTKLGVPVLATIGDEQETLLEALEQTWSHVPHQACRFHEPPLKRGADFRLMGQGK